MIDLNPKFKIGEILHHNNNKDLDLYGKLKVIRYHPEEYRTYYILGSELLGREIIIHIDSVENRYESESILRNKKIMSIL